jgi:hypothetical protein
MVVFGTLPAIILGAWLGGIGHRTRDKAVWTRLVRMALPSLVFVALAGAMFDLPRLILPACAPTLLSVLALEHLTRARRERALLDGSVLLARMSAGGR